MIKLEDLKKSKFELCNDEIISLKGGGNIVATGTKYYTDKTNSDGSTTCGGDTEWEGQDTCWVKN